MTIVSLYEDLLLGDCTYQEHVSRPAARCSVPVAPDGTICFRLCLLHCVGLEQHTMYRFVIAVRAVML